MDPEYTFTVRSYVYNVILIPYVDIPGQLYTRHAVDADSDTELLGRCYNRSTPGGSAPGC